MDTNYIKTRSRTTHNEIIHYKHRILNPHPPTPSKKEKDFIFPAGFMLTSNLLVKTGIYIYWGEKINNLMYYYFVWPVLITAPKNKTINKCSKDRQTDRERESKRKGWRVGGGGGGRGGRKEGGEREREKKKCSVSKYYVPKQQLTCTWSHDERDLRHHPRRHDITL